ncbi:MAG: hypothetical protein JKY82_05560 [Rhizobiaceae bacterium]|nr:hypothetical protein [Rhizobiaceae bacterium]
MTTQNKYTPNSIEYLSGHMPVLSMPITVALEEAFKCGLNRNSGIASSLSDLANAFVSQEKRYLKWEMCEAKWQDHLQSTGPHLHQLSEYLEIDLCLPHHENMELVEQHCNHHNSTYFSSRDGSSRNTNCSYENVMTLKHRLKNLYSEMENHPLHYSAEDYDEEVSVCCDVEYAATQIFLKTPVFTIEEMRLKLGVVQLLTIFTDNDFEPEETVALIQSLNPALAA